VTTSSGVTVSTVARTLRDLQSIDFTRDLLRRTIRITSDGVSIVAAPESRLSSSELLELFYYMTLTRAVDLEIVKLSRKGLAFGKHLMCTGNEASAVGATYALHPDDWAAVAIRDLGAFLVRGVRPAQVLAQACGRLNGLTGGWDGSLHMGSRAHRIAGLVSHLGTLVAIGTGCAFAERYRETDNVVLAFIGEGSTSTGDFHEALNIASVLRLPMVVVIENNQWAFGTPAKLQYAVPTVAARALAYGPGTEGVCVDGTDVVAVHDVVSDALVRARRDRTMTLIETVSMRLQGHSLADPFTRYVPAEQLQLWQTRDPLTVFRARLLGSDAASAEELSAVERRVTDELRQAALEAEAGPVPDATNIEQTVFAPGRVDATRSSGRCTTKRRGGPRNIPYYKAIQDALREELERDAELFMIGEDIGISDGAFKITEGFSKRFDQLDWTKVWNVNERFHQRRIIDAPIAEAGFSGLALGAALAGLRSVVEFQYADFASEAFKMIVNYAATQTVRSMGPVPVVFRLPSGWAPNTSIYHSVNPESWFASTPGIKIVAPVSAYDAKGLLKAAIRDNNPVLYLEYKAHYRIAPEKLPTELNIPIPDEDFIVPIGSARVLREGSDLSLVAYGSQVFRALAAADQVAREDGASIEVIDLRTLVPYDRDCVRRSVERTSRVVVTCEAPATGCFGNTVVSDIAATTFTHLDAPVTLVAAADTPVPFAPSLEQAHLPTIPKVVAAIRRTLAY
jgi:pyruvate/2-oxoglutarate/acetoin dehydrogenase E1 component/TPP-dependent pyruvate/acetoin dehydrogenase alpha subunit